NPLGIYDLHGNVSEWTSSEEASGRVIRGGGWHTLGIGCEASYCSGVPPEFDDHDSLGFRLLAVRRLRELGRSKIGDILEGPLTSSLKMKFAWVRPGTSWLGGGGGTLGQEQFRLDKSLWCGVYPVMQAEWQAVMGDNPSHFKNKPRHPVENVSWHRVQ